ncbi:MAG: protein-export chaperone SecB [Gammaproteobacteria bacterium]|nr:protein-export chaperone SecB [Gammaproteobacteria bacterium]
MNASENVGATENGEHGPEFAIQRIYVKDSSFESPESPNIFREPWEPKVNIDLQTTSSVLEGNVYEVILGVTVTVKIKEKTAFLAETKQAGIFSIGNFNEEQRSQLLGSFCPNILFPYARETITSLVTRGGFPQLYLAPINFDAVYQQQLKQGEEGVTTN